MPRQLPLIEGIGLGGYRSFRTFQTVGPLSKVTLIVGQNNAGKSNVLRFAQTFVKQNAPRRQALDEPQPAGEPLTMALAIRFSREDVEQDWTRITGDAGSPHQAVLKRIFNHVQFRLTDDDLLWFKYVQEDQEQSGARRWLLDGSPLTAVTDDLDPQTRQALANTVVHLTNSHYGSEIEQMAQLIGLLLPLNRLPQIYLIDAFRRISDGSAETEQFGFNGEGLKKRLQQLQNPSLDLLANKQRFAEINSFVQSVLDDPTAELEIPSEADVIHVRRAQITLPLENLGTGLHQVIILAVAATLIENSLVCIEEPEVHLHPVLQRKLVRYLNANTSNHYLIATHSAQMLDYQNATVVHVRATQIGSVATTSSSSQQSISDICADLGYRPSDLMQANSIIWVEGPSDRTYVTHWIKQMNDRDDLIEGIDFSVMFYGGRLLNHLTANDDEVAEFISLTKINRHSVILIDTDKDRANKRINATKTRVRTEFDAHERPGFAWLTDGRTIENYVPAGLLNSAHQSIHPGIIPKYAGDKWADPFHSVRASGRAKAPSPPDKVKIAAKVCAEWTDLIGYTPSLRRDTRRLIEFIHTANGRT